MLFSGLPNLLSHFNELLSRKVPKLLESYGIWLPHMELLYLMETWNPSKYLILFDWCGLPFEVTHCFNILLRVSYFYSNNISALNMIFSVTYYMEFCIAISIYYVSHILPSNFELVVWTLQNINDFTWQNGRSIVKRYSIV